MTDRQTVVRNRSKISDQRLHDLLMIGWSRCIARYGKNRFAAELDITTDAIDKHLRGSMPGFSVIIDALAFEPTVTDDVFAEAGLRLVPKDAVCTTDTIAAPALCAALMKVIEAEADGVKTHTELLGMEQELREAGRSIDAMLARITQLRTPRQVA